MKNESTIKAVNTLNMILDLIVREICEGVAVYDDSGKLVHSNPKGSEIISAMVGKVDANTRKRIDSAIDLFELYRDVKDQEACTILDRRRTSFYITTHRIKDDGLKDPGYKCILFKDAEKAQKLSQRMVYGQKPFFTFDDIVGDHDTLTEAIHEARMAAQTDVPILLMGETGTGKEMFAQSIHNASAVSSGPFVALNCAALPAELIESELFGYESGSFTGARKGGKPGKLETADGGTVFLDELDSMPINLQSKLLRVLQTRTVSRIGGEKEIPISIRIVSASKTSLLKQVEKGLFRDDLFFRLNTIVIELPPLRERKSDIPLLCDHFLRRLNARNSKQIRRLSGEASRILMSYDWPGNVRELEGCIERAFVFEKTDHLEPSSLPPHILEHACEPQDRVDPRRLEDYEAALIAETLRESLGNIARAARSLGIGRDTLYRKIRKYEIDVRNHRGLGALSR